MAAGWSGADLSLGPRDLALWQRARQETGANRRGNAIVRVIDENGQPLRGVPVRFEQRHHAFTFGAHYPYHEATYDLLQQAGINGATLWLGWADVEPESGLYDLEFLERIWNPAELHQRGLRITAHALNWFKSRWRVLPPYLFEVGRHQLPHLVYDHVRRLAQRWSPYIDTFELVNEPFWVEASAIPLDVDDMVRICHATALAVRDECPSAKLEVNFAEVSRLPSYLVRPHDFLEALVRADVSYHRIGLQMFDNSYSVTKPPTYYRSKTLAGLLQIVRQYASIGKPLHISALAVPSVPPVGKAPAAYRPAYGEWDEATQARYLDGVFTLFFAERTVEAITWWCPVDGRLSYIPSGGLLRSDLTPKPSYRALQQWMQRHTTSGQMVTDGDGRAIIDGYAGEYQVDVGVGSMGRGFSQSIVAGEVREQSVVLAYSA